MLSAQDNDVLCRVGPDTPMGKLMREYWIPALMPNELIADGPPMRLRLLGENLIASVDPQTGRVHSTFHQLVTATGRLASHNPNLQNIPVRQAVGRA